jgi:hypothetical protein
MMKYLTRWVRVTFGTENLRAHLGSFSKTARKALLIIFNG